MQVLPYLCGILASFSRKHTFRMKKKIYLDSDLTDFILTLSVLDLIE